MTLHFAILSFDRYSRDSLIGEVFFTLNEKDVLESIEKEQVSIQKDIVLRSVKVYIVNNYTFLKTVFDVFKNYLNYQKYRPVSITGDGVLYIFIETGSEQRWGSGVCAPSPWLCGALHCGVQDKKFQ